jgi:hypothetical protein
LRSDTRDDHLASTTVGIDGIAALVEFAELVDIAGMIETAAAVDTKVMHGSSLAVAEIVRD